MTTYPDDGDDVIRNIEGAYALMAGIFEVAMRDAQHPRYRGEAMDWLAWTGARWATCYGDADEETYLDHIASIEPGADIYIPIDENRFVGELCARGHEYEDTGGSLRWQHHASQYCIECEKEHRQESTTRRRLRKMRPAAETYEGALCKHGHTYNDKPRSLRYKGSRYCVECDAIAKETRALLMGRQVAS